MTTKTYPCKIGTMPSLVIVCGNYKLTPGNPVKVREAKHGSKPFRIRIVSTGSHYFFAERL